jgi:ssDNA-binding replication factor A large subunit
MGDERVINVADLRPGMKSISCLFIVLDIGEPTTTKEGHTVRSVLVADRTGCISLSVWDEWGEAVKSGDILKLSKG